MPRTPDGMNYMSKDFLNNLNPNNFYHDKKDDKIEELENKIKELEIAFNEMNEKLKGLINGK